MRFQSDAYRKFNSLTDPRYSVEGDNCERRFYAYWVNDAGEKVRIGDEVGYKRAEAGFAVCHQHRKERCPDNDETTAEGIRTAKS